VLKAQSPIGGFMQGKGKGNIALSYNSESYDKVFLVPEKIDGVPVFNRVKTTSVNFFGTFGLSNKVDLQLSLPYIKSTGEASQQVLDNLGYQNQRSGLQDVSAYVKYNPYNFKMGKGKLSLIGAVGVQTPLGGYNVDESLQSIIAIGTGVTQLNTFILSQYKLDNGLFFNGSLGYSLRSKDVPNAFISELKAGYANKSFYIDAYATSQLSGDGPDILKEGFTGVFNRTRVNYNRIGVNVFVPIIKSFGVAAGASSYVAGRNLGQSSGGYGALIFSF
jgi:hypothetical protein